MPFKKQHKYPTFDIYKHLNYGSNLQPYTISGAKEVILNICNLPLKY